MFHDNQIYGLLIFEKIKQNKFINLICAKKTFLSFFVLSDVKDVLGGIFKHGRPYNHT